VDASATDAGCDENAVLSASQSNVLGVACGGMEDDGDGNAPHINLALLNAQLNAQVTQILDKKFNEMFSKVTAHLSTQLASHEASLVKRVLGAIGESSNSLAGGKDALAGSKDSLASIARSRSMTGASPLDVAAPRPVIRQPHRSTSCTSMLVNADGASGCESGNASGCASDQDPACNDGRRRRSSCSVFSSRDSKVEAETAAGSDQDPACSESRRRRSSCSMFSAKDSKVSNAKIPMFRSTGPGLCCDLTSSRQSQF